MVKERERKNTFFEKRTTRYIQIDKHTVKSSMKQANKSVRYIFRTLNVENAFTFIINYQ